MTPQVRQFAEWLSRRPQKDLVQGDKSLPAHILSGPVAYDLIWEEMKRRQSAVIAGDPSAEAILWVEHHPTITRGRGLQLRQGADGHQAASRQMPLLVSQLPPTVEYREIERGGDLTAHEPGQLVIYPVVHLKNRDLSQYLRGMESFLIEALNEILDVAGHGDKAFAIPDSSGVWIRSQRWSQPKKIASLGVSIRSWVTMHGMALNICNTLETFRWIQPCGFAPEAMVTLESVAPGWMRQIFPAASTTRDLP